MTVTDAGQTKVYVRRNLTDSWIDRTATLLLGSTVERSAGRVTGLMLRESQATVVPMVTSSDLHKWWVKVTYTPDAGAETLIWYGNIEDSRINEGLRRIEWYASSIEAQLRRIRLGHAYAAGYLAVIPGTQHCKQITMPRFNRNLDDTDRMSGLRSTTFYHFRRSDPALYLHPFTMGDRDTDLGYVFGTEAVWSNFDILMALLAFYTGRDQDGKAHCPLSFDLNTTAASLAYLDGMKQSWNFRGKNLQQAIEALVRQSGPLIWWCDPSEYDAGNSEHIDLYVRSRLYADEKDTGSVVKHTITDYKADCMPAVIRRRVKSRVTQVTARGAPVKVVFSVKHADAASPTMKVAGPTYVEGWTSAEETAWLAASDEVRRAPENQHVFLRFAIPWNQADGSDVSTWQRLFCYYDLVQQGSAFGDMIIEESTDAPAPTGYYAHPRRLLRANLLYPGYTYSSANDGTMPAAPGSAVVKAAFQPILAWWYPASIGSGEYVTPLPSPRVLSDYPGVQFGNPSLVLGVESEGPGLANPESTLDNWKHLVLTVSMATDVHISYSAGIGNWTDDQKRSEIIEVPECEWWAAAGAAVNIAPDGTVTWAYGVIRNDLPKLKKIAEERLSVLNRTGGSGIYQPHYHGQIPFKVVRVAYGGNAVGLGDFVQSYGPYDVHEPIMSITHELMNMKEWGTMLTTYKAVSRRDTP